MSEGRHPIRPEFEDYIAAWLGERPFPAAFLRHYHEMPFERPPLTRRERISGWLRGHWWGARHALAHRIYPWDDGDDGDDGL